MTVTILYTLLATLVANPAADRQFWQEYSRSFQSPTASPVLCLAPDEAGGLYAGTAENAYYASDPGKGAWAALIPDAQAATVYGLCVDARGGVWIAATSGLWRSEGAGAQAAQPMLQGTPVAAVAPMGDGIVAVGPEGIWTTDGETLAHAAMPYAKNIRAVLPDGPSLWIATASGLYRHNEANTQYFQEAADILSCDVRDLALDGTGRLWAVGLGGATLFDQGRRSATRTPAEGIPCAELRCAAQGPDGRMWLGTAQGLVRFGDTGASVRHSRRWLLDDDVRDIAFDADGNAWVATAKGISAIMRKRMSLEEKAAHFQEVCMERHVRPPFIVERCRLPKPGNTTKWEPEDDDNDGGYTALHLVAEICRYRVTQAPDALENAKKIFDFLEFLQTVTKTPGFFARTVVPSDWERMHDPNRTYTEAQIAEARVRDPRFKPVEKRWHPTDDGKWLWKGDTSSDEVTAHFFGYLMYYDLIDDEAERARVRGLVTRIMDYIMEHGYVFMDIDGSHTRWGVWAPEKLNGDPHWRAERGINSAEIVGYLNTAYHMTGDVKYREAALELLYEHNYIEHIRKAKTYAPGWITHIDTELLTFVYPCLMLHEKDPDLLAVYRESLEHWYGGVRNEDNAFANVVYALLTGNDPERERTLFMLRDTPLDLINWHIDNRPREDLSIVRRPILENLQSNRLLPPSERGVIRWDKNPWAITQGDGGHTEWAPSFWLVPYWMARHQALLDAAPTTSTE